MIDRARCRGWGAAADCTVAVLGVPSDAVLAFLHLLYSSDAAVVLARSRRLVAPGTEELVAAHGPQLLALAHVYRVGWLKRAAEAAVSARLTADRAVDMLKLARLCDAPRLYTRCARLADKDFAAVEASDGWRFARRHDPALELKDADNRRARASQEAYRELGQAMGSLNCIFACGTDVDAPSVSPGTCQGLRLLMRHFASSRRAHARSHRVAARGASACCSSSDFTPPSATGRSRTDRAACRSRAATAAS